MIITMEIIIYNQIIFKIIWKFFHPFEIIFKVINIKRILLKIYQVKIFLKSFKMLWKKINIILIISNNFKTLLTNNWFQIKVIDLIIQNPPFLIELVKKVVKKDNLKIKLPKIIINLIKNNINIINLNRNTVGTNIP